MLFPEILSGNGQMTLNFTVNQPHFNTSCGNPNMHISCKFGDCSSNPLKVIAQTSQSHNGQNDLEGQSQLPPFSIPAESIPGCMFGTNLLILAQVCDRVILQTKYNLRTDRRMDGQMQITTIPLQPDRKKKNQYVCMYTHIQCNQ